MNELHLRLNLSTRCLQQSLPREFRSLTLVAADASKPDRSYLHCCGSTLRLKPLVHSNCSTSASTKLDAVHGGQVYAKLDGPHSTENQPSLVLRFLAGRRNAAFSSFAIYLINSLVVEIHRNHAIVAETGLFTHPLISLYRKQRLFLQFRHLAANLPRLPRLRATKG